MANFPWLAPPVALLIVLAAVLLASLAAARLSFVQKDPQAGARKGYACGENVERPWIQPDYAEFFPFAFFFTILHVVALIVATAETESAGAVVMALVYVAGAMIGLSILFRKASADAAAAQDDDLGQD